MAVNAGEYYQDFDPRSYCAAISDVAKTYLWDVPGWLANIADYRRVFDYVRRIPFQAEKIELFRTPSETFALGGDCDDKTILVLGWALSRSLPCRVVLSSIADKWDHVFPEILTAGGWVTMDATYPDSQINKRHGVEFYEWTV